MGYQRLSSFSFQLSDECLELGSLISAQPNPLAFRDHVLKIRVSFVATEQVIQCETAADSAKAPAS
jgi:hypothetical protein